MKNPPFEEATTETILRNIFTLGFGKPTPSYPPITPTAPLLSPERRIFDAGRSAAEVALDIGASEIILRRLNAPERIPFNSIDDGLQHALADKAVETPGPDAAAKARFEAFLQSLTPSEFLFQFRRAGLAFDNPGFVPDLTNFQNVEFILEFERRKSLQQITPDGRLVQPIGPRITLPLAPPPRSLPIGFPATPPAGFAPTPGTVPSVPPERTAPVEGRPVIGLPPGFVPGDAPGTRRPVRPVGPVLDTLITVADGIASGSAKAVDKSGNAQVPPDGLRPPVPGSGGTGRPPAFGQAFPDPLFQRNPPDP